MLASQKVLLQRITGVMLLAFKVGDKRHFIIVAIWCLLAFNLNRRLHHRVGVFHGQAEIIAALPASSVKEKKEQHAPL